MPQYARIINGAVELVEENIVARTTLADAIPHLATPRDFDLYNLPVGLRNVFNRGEDNQMDLMVEQPPRVRTIRYTGSRHSGRSTEYAVAIPWTYFIFTALIRNNTMSLNEWRIFGAKDRAVRADSIVFPMPLHNVYHSGSICFGTASADPSHGLGPHIDQLVRNFWLSDFNDDVAPAFRPHGDYAGWQTATEADDTCWRQWDTQRYELPLSTLVRITPDRTTPILVGDAIPELPLAPTFGRVDEWVSDLTEAQRERLRHAVNR